MDLLCLDDYHSRQESQCLPTAKEEEKGDRGQEKGQETLSCSFGVPVPEKKRTLMSSWTRKQKKQAQLGGRSL